MGREKEAFRDNLELVLNFLDEKYHDKRKMLCNTDIQEFTGLKYDYVKKKYMNGSRYVSAVVFARTIS